MEMLPLPLLCKPELREGSLSSQLGEICSWARGGPKRLCQGAEGERWRGRGDPGRDMASAGRPETAA